MATSLTVSASRRSSLHDRASFIRCLAHIINLICKDILTQLGVGSVREAKTALDHVSAARDRWPSESSANALAGKNVVVKIRVLVLWIARSPQRLQEWREVSPRKLISHDVETRWNSTHNDTTALRGPTRLCPSSISSTSAPQPTTTISASSPRYLSLFPTFPFHCLPHT
jgi:hypothetical protein